MNRIILASASLSSICCLALSNSYAQIPQGIFTDVTNIGPISDTPAFDFLPSVSADGLTLYFDDTRNGGQTPFPENKGQEDMWMATRSSRDEKFDNVVNLGPVNTSYYDDMGTVSHDGLSLYFSSNREGKSDLYRATRATVSEQFGDVVPIHDDLYPPEFRAISPSVTPDELTMVFNVYDEPNNPNNHDVWLATRRSTDEPFLDARRLTMNRDDVQDIWPSISADGRFIFVSDWTGAPPRDGGYGGEDIWVSMRTPLEGEFDMPENLNDFWPGSTVNSSARVGYPFISFDWPADGSQIYWSATGPGPTFGNVDIFQATWDYQGTIGDFDYDDVLDIADLDLLVSQVKSALNLRFYDVDGNVVVDANDLTFWIRDLKQTWIGDTNLDGEFNSADLVAAFIAGQYEDNIADNSTWATGDWNFDGEFDSSDIVFAFQDGGYEAGPRPSEPIAVPESQSRIVPFAAFAISAFFFRRRNGHQLSQQRF